MLPHFLSFRRFSARITAFIAAIVGLLLIVASFFLLHHSRPLRLLRTTGDSASILALAEEVYQRFHPTQPLPSCTIKTRIDRDMLNYSLENRRDEDLPVGRWVIDTKSRGKDDEGDEIPAFRVEFDFSGRLLGLRRSAPPQRLINEAGAAARVRRFMEECAEPEPPETLKPRTIRRNEKSSVYEFEFTLSDPKRANLLCAYAFTVSGEGVIRFAKTYTSTTYNIARGNNIADTVYSVLMFLAWAVLAIYMLACFFRKMRHDELDFKRTGWVAVVMLLLTFSLVAMSAWPAWEGMLIGGGFAGLFAAIAVYLVFATADSVARDNAPEKLTISDLLLSGRLRVQETGHAVLQSFWFSGFALLLTVLLLQFCQAMGWGVLSLHDSRLTLLQHNQAVWLILLRNLVYTIFFSLMWLLFWSSYLKRKIITPFTRRLVLLVFLVLSGAFIGFFRVTPLSILFYLPMAALWVWWLESEDFLTLTLSFFNLQMFLDFALIGAVPGAFLGYAGLTLIILLTAQFILGLVCSLSPRRATEVGNYVPEYVSRIAERQRLLQELEIARNVQNRFLPQSTPRMPEFDIAGICQPAMEVGGDYYDFILSENREYLGVIVGDVAGKGVSAAFYMTMMKGIIKTLTKKTLEPKKVLSELNEIFKENAPRNIFISVIFGLFDLRNTTFTFARAGHNPLIIRRRAAAGPEQLNPRGLAIGLERSAIFNAAIEDRSIFFEPGDVFVFYTDGISEAMSPEGEEFGQQRLIGLVEELVDFDAAVIRDSIIQDVNHYQGPGMQHDDFTLVVVKILSPAPAVLSS